jgi:hypothetical protein
VFGHDNNIRSTGDEPTLGGPGRAAPGGSEPWLGGEHGIQRALDALISGDDRAIWRAGRSLADAGPMAIPRLYALLDHPDTRVRAVTAWTLQ